MCDGVYEATTWFIYKFVESTLRWVFVFNADFRGEFRCDAHSAQPYGLDMLFLKRFQRGENLRNVFCESHAENIDD